MAVSLPPDKLQFAKSLVQQVVGQRVVRCQEHRVTGRTLGPCYQSVPFGEGLFEQPFNFVFWAEARTVQEAQL